MFGSTHVLLYLHVYVYMYMYIHCMHTSVWTTYVSVEMLCCVQSGVGEEREEVDGDHSSAAPHKWWQFWKQSGEKKPKKFGWITGVLVRSTDDIHVHVRLRMTCAIIPCECEFKGTCTCTCKGGSLGTRLHVHDG